MIAPALVDGKPLSHPDLDRAWSAFVERGISPCFHVADQPKVFDEAWYTDRSELGVAAVDAVLLHVPVALACTDLILNGVLERHPDLRIGIVELSAVWVPLYLMMLDGGSQFVRRLNGRGAALSLRPSDYFRRQVRVSSFAYELPAADPARARRSRPPHVRAATIPTRRGRSGPSRTTRRRASTACARGRPATVSRQRGVPAAEGCMKRPIPRFNHVALTVPGELLDAEGRSDLLRFHERVFGWTEMPTMTRDRELLVLRAWSNEQFVYLHASPEPMRAGETEHFGLSVPEVGELDAMYERAEKFRAEDGRVELLARETQDFQVVKLHSFYVRYRLPLMIEVQCFEWAPGFGPERTA